MPFFNPLFCCTRITSFGSWIYFSTALLTKPFYHFPFFASFSRFLNIHGQSISFLERAKGLEVNPFFPSDKLFASRKNDSNPFPESNRVKHRCKEHKKNCSCASFSCLNLFYSLSWWRASSTIGRPSLI